MSRNPEFLQTLVEHLNEHSVRTDGPFTLRSGIVSDWYLDARQTTFSGEGARLVGLTMLGHISPEVEAVGGLTMGADPVAISTAIAAAESGRDLSAFSIRKEEKEHGTGGRLVGPVGPGTKVSILEDTTTTGGAMAEAVTVARREGLEVVEVVALIDRSGGAAGRRMVELGVPYSSVITPADLGLE